jgi:pyocin large subunit-like protein
VPYTRGFRDPGYLADHFLRHGIDVGATNETEYELLADSFLGAPLAPGVQEGFRRNGDILRYNIITEEFGVLSRDGFIKTYYKPNPSIHGEATNLQYFQKECLK